jgi:hypothetical protein
MRFILFTPLPFSTVDDPLFRNLAPALPKRDEFTRQVNVFATMTKEALRARLAECSYLSIQYDGWMARDRSRYIGVMCQGLHGTRFIEYNLGTIPVTAQVRDAPEVARLVGDVIERYAIEPRSCVTDSEAVESAALRQMNLARERNGHPKMTWFPCFCHLINLILRAFAAASKDEMFGLRELERSLGECCAFTAFLRSVDSKRLTIARPTEIRWSSKIEMCYSVVALKNHILAFRNTPQAAQAIRDAEDLIPVLGIFEEVLHRFETNEPGLIGEIHRSIGYLRMSLSFIIQSQGRWAAAATAAVKKLEELVTKHQADLYPLCLVAARVNPSLDHETTLSAGDMQIADQEILAALADVSGAIDEGADAQIVRDPPPALSIPSYSDFGKLGPSTRSPAPQTACEQYGEYLAVLARERNHGIKHDGPLIDYWLGKRDEWPDLATFALDVLMRPVTSVATERHFSDTGRILTIRRMRMLPDNVDDAALILANREISEDLIN